MSKTSLFLSYSSKDHFFAALAEIKLAESDIHLWRDQGQLRAGTDWRKGIEIGISSSDAVLLALSQDSAESPYVTYEWAYALGKGKTVIPIKLEECSIHPKLETIQHLDFSAPNALPWQPLIDRIGDIEIDDSPAQLKADISEAKKSEKDPLVKQILSYLNQRGYQMASFERLKRRIDESITDEQFERFIEDNSTIFRKATLKGGKQGLAKLIP